MGSRKDEKPKIEDEPGAEERFARILKRALNTPPSRKQDRLHERKGKKPVGRKR
jgi:hypothetical protein